MCNRCIHRLVCKLRKEREKQQFGTISSINNTTSVVYSGCQHFLDAAKIVIREPIQND